MQLNDVLALVNDSVRGLSAYHLEPAPSDIKLNQNENPWDWPAKVKEELALFCRDRPWNRYPPFIPGELKSALASYAGIDSAGVIAGNGSNEILLTLLIALMDRSKPVILCQPTFTVYDLLITGLGGQTAPVMLSDNLTYEMDSLLTACRANPGSLAILCTPNNPTGCSLSERQIRSLLAVHTGMLVLDQAYVEFGGFDAAPLLREYPNLLITRTFSKAFAGAGLRIGYLLGTPGVITEINKVKLPYNLNFFTERVAQTILREREWAVRTVAQLKGLRDSLYESLQAFPFERVYPSDANFICCRTRHKDRLMKHLADKGILIRDVSKYPMLDNCVRVNTGTPQENETLIEAIKSFFAASTGA